MPRVRKGAARRRKHKKILKAARGFFGAGSRRYRIALDKTFRAGVSATRDRRLRKRNFRRLWITRITAACKQRGLRYSQFIYGLTEADIMLNRKMLSEIAIADPAAFDELVALAQTAAARPKAAPVKKAEKPEKKAPKAEKKPKAAAPAEAKPEKAEAPAKEEKKPAKKAAKKTAKKAEKADAADEAKPAKKTAKKTAKKAVKKDDTGEEKPAKKKAVKKTVKKAAKKTAKKSEKKDD
jgi:large subunit ribosomal protein L20